MTLLGTDGPNRLEVVNVYYAMGAATIHGLAGDDVLVGGGGDDLLNGGPGRDEASGSTGSDRCLAEVRRACER